MPPRFFPLHLEGVHSWSFILIWHFGVAPSVPPLLRASALIYGQWALALHPWVWWHFLAIPLGVTLEQDSSYRKKKIVQENCLSALQEFFRVLWVLLFHLSDMTEKIMAKEKQLNWVKEKLWNEKILQTSYRQIWCCFWNSELLINTKNLYFRSLWSIFPYVSLCLSKIHILSSLNPILYYLWLFSYQSLW